MSNGEGMMNELLEMAQDGSLDASMGFRLLLSAIRPMYDSINNLNSQMAEAISAIGNMTKQLGDYSKSNAMACEASQRKTEGDLALLDERIVGNSIRIERAEKLRQNYVDLQEWGKKMAENVDDKLDAIAEQNRLLSLMVDELSKKVDSLDENIMVKIGAYAQANPIKFIGLVIGGIIVWTVLLNSGAWFMLLDAFDIGNFSQLFTTPIP